ncbi:MAG: type II secretion system F family protein [Bacillota bacterium]
MLVIISLTTMVSVYFLQMAFVQLMKRKQDQIHERLKQLVGEIRQENELSELDLPFVQRVVYPGLRQVSQIFSKGLPQARREILMQKLLLAGSPGGLAPNEFIGLQYGLSLTIMLTIAIISLLLNAKASTALLCGAAGALLGGGLPRLYLNQKTQERHDQMERSLPDILDLLSVSVEAGLGFDAALGKVCEKTTGVVAEEFSRLLKEIRMGKPRRDALRDMARRSTSTDLASFIGSVVQADQLGISMGNVLRLQSQQMRQKRRQKAEEKAMKVPIKMLIPLVIFIFPGIFIVLLGPAMIQFFQIFSK